MVTRRLARVALLAWLSGLAPSALAQRTVARDEIPPACWSQETVVETKNYELHVLGPAQDAEELGRVLEAAREQFKAFFRAAPRGRERVAIHLAPDRASWLECMRARGIEPPSNADFAHYAPEEDALFVYRQRSEWLTRAVLIHGACQQFHCKCKPKNRDLVRTWISMGLGDHMSVHTWDGKTLALGARPLLDPTDLLARAQERLDPARFDPQRLYEEGLMHAEVGFALVRYVLEGDDAARRQAFEKLALGYTGSKLDASTYTAKLGSPVEVATELHAWLARNQQPLRATIGEWEDRGAGRLIGSVELEGGFAVADFKQAFELLRLRLPAGEVDGLSGGVTFRYDDDLSWYRMLVTSAGVFVREIRHGRIAREHELPFAVEVGTPVEIELRRSGDDYLVRCGTEEVLVNDVQAPHLGLFVREGPLEIEVLEVR